MSLPTLRDNNYGLSSRYEIRQLTSTDFDAIKATILHSNWFHSPIWAPKYATQPINAMYDNCDYWLGHQLVQGLSYGVFDSEYVYNIQKQKN